MNGRSSSTVARQMDVPLGSFPKSVSRMRLDDRLRFLVGPVCSLLAMHCGSGAKIQSVPNFEGKSLKSQVVLVLPIAVTDDFGDERTGIVLDHQSREQATKLACDSAAEMRDDVKIMCFDRPELAR